MQVEGQWQDGPEDGGIARTQAVRLLAELAGVPELHPLLVKAGAAAALADQGAELVGPSLSAAGLGCCAWS